MTEDEVTKVLGDLHMLHLVNEPNNIDDLIYSWLAFFGQDDARIINKACYIYTKIRKNRYWPTPGDIEDLKLRAQWLVEIEDEDKKKLNALGGETHTYPQSMNQSTLPPRAPAINIAEKAQDFCQLCGLCEIRDQSKCPFDY